MDGKLVILVLGISMILFVGTYANDPPKVVSTFDCSKDNSDCSNNGTCDLSKGTCACDGDFGGYDCRIPDVSAPCDPATNICHATYTRECYIDGTNKCSCHPGYTGAKCDNKYSTLTCSSGRNFELKWTPYTKIAMRYPLSVTPINESCITGPVSDVYTIAIHDAGSLNTACGVSEELFADGTVTYKVNIVFQSSALWLTPSDDIAQLSCNYTSTGTVNTGAGIGSLDSVTVDSTDPTGGFNTVVDLTSSDNANLIVTSHLRRKVNTVWGLWQPVTGGTTAVVGNHFRMTVELDGPPAFAKIRLEECWLDNNGGPNPAVQILNDSCAFSEGLTTLQDIARTNDTIISISVDVLRFTNTTNTKLRLVCKVKICIQSDITSCDTKNCSTSYGGLTSNGEGRRRRDTTSSHTESGIVKAWIPVVPESGYERQHLISKEECTLSREFITIIVILCVLILLLSVAVVFLALRRRNRRRKEVEDRYTTYSTSGSKMSDTYKT